MTRLRCDQEPAVSRAVRTGFWSDALERHAESCSICAEARTISQALLEESTRLRTAASPGATQVWLEARRRARLHLRHRASLWFRALRTLTCVYAVAAFAWLSSHHATPAASRWSPSFHADFASLLSGPAEILAVAGALAAALCISMGSWYLLREARQPLQPNPGR